MKQLKKKVGNRYSKKIILPFYLNVYDKYLDVAKINICLSPYTLV